VADPAPSAATVNLPGAVLARAMATTVRGALRADWQGSALGRWLAVRPRPTGFATGPRDFRPPNPQAGRAVLAGVFVAAGATLAVGPGGDPWDRPSPSRGFAAALHQFAFLRDLAAVEAHGAAEGLRLYLEWRRLFGAWSAFAWRPEVLERRVFNLACAGQALAAPASDAEAELLAADLARQARALLADPEPGRAAERAAAAAVAGAALSGRAGERLLARALRRLERALVRTVRPDGGHASRRADAALELLFDLQTLTDALSQRGLAAPEGVLRAVDRLAAAVRFATLADGGLMTLQGGAALSAPYVAAARAQDELGDRPVTAAFDGYQRLDGRRLQLVVDAAPPTPGPFGLAARGQPLGMEVLANGRRLIVAAAGRGVACGSTVTMANAPFGRVLQGFAGRRLGPELRGAQAAVSVERHEAPGALWLELAHEGWMRRFGVRHQRRLYLDVAADELRGEDRLTPTARAQGPDGRHFIPFAVRFHLAPGVSALVSQDRRSVLLRPEGETLGWVFRNDALEVAMEPSVAGPPEALRPTQQIVLRGHRRADSGARVRWKLAPAAPRVDAAGREA